MMAPILLCACGPVFALCKYRTHAPRTPVFFAGPDNLALVLLACTPGHFRVKQKNAGAASPGGLAGRGWGVGLGRATRGCMLFF